MTLTERFSLQHDPSSDELTVRALALFRNGLVASAADHLQAIPRNQYSKLTWAVASLIQIQLDDEGAKATLRQAAKIIRKPQYPDCELALLLAEAEAIENQSDEISK